MSLKKERNQAITLVPVVLPAGPTGGVRGGHRQYQFRQMCGAGRSEWGGILWLK
ncbi:TPA: hypothetical protein ACJG8Q_003919 [Salmonella enterica subsp. diarizonae serovar 61:i:z]